MSDVAIVVENISLITKNVLNNRKETLSYDEKRNL